MDGQEFFKLLKELYDPELHSYLKDNHIDPNHELGSSQWTELMGKVLEKIRVEADFDSGECKKEVSVLTEKGRGRIDHKWERSDQTVFIENENKPYSDPQPEIKNLLNSDGDLRILIVYSKISSDNESIKENVLQQLRKNISNRKFEFLLVIGKGYVNSSDDWEAVSYRLAFESFPLAT